MGKAAKKKGKGSKKEKEAPKKEAGTPKKAPPKKHKSRNVQEEEGVRGIVRLAGKDVEGHIPLERALLRVKGIGQTTKKTVSRIIAKELNVAPDVKVGTFTDPQIEQIDKILGSIHDYGVPPFLLNCRKDRDSGKDRHNIMTSLVFSQRQDIEAEKNLYTWRGYRHNYGQRVRGQRTRNTGRKGMSLGVLKKTLIAASKGGASGSKGGAKKEDKK